MIINQRELLYFIFFLTVVHLKDLGRSRSPNFLAIMYKKFQPIEMRILLVADWLAEKLTERMTPPPSSPVLEQRR